MAAHTDPGLMGFSMELRGEGIQRNDLSQTSEGSRMENIRASGASRQHNGNHYNNTINNFAAAKPYNSVPVKPAEDAVHSDFMRACLDGQESPRLDFLFRNGANIEHRDHQRSTPLHHAASSGKLATLKYVIEAGADVHAYGERIGTPLHHAASSTSVDAVAAVQFLLDVGANIQATDEWIGTPLHHAAFSGSAGTVRCLIAGGADFHAFGEWVGTPLSIAAARGHLAVVAVLLEHKVNVNQDCGYFGSATHMACAGGNMEILQMLQQQGANFSWSRKTCYAIYRDILDSTYQTLPSSLGSRDPARETVFDSIPGVLAIDQGNLAAVQFCLGLGISQRLHETYDTSWYTKVTWRHPSCIEEDSINLAVGALDIDMLRLLLEREFKLDVGCYTMSYLGSCHTRRAPLPGTNASHCISLLLQNGAHNSCLSTKTATTLLMEVLLNGNESARYEVVKAVLERGAPVNAVNDQGQTALMIAAGTNHQSRLDCMKLLCKHGAAVDMKDKNERTALRYAMKWGGDHNRKEVQEVLECYGEIQRMKYTCSIL
ncbi:hypothetical protein Q7P37_009065 [Cladosporium fusiforme]